MKCLKQHLCELADRYYDDKKVLSREIADSPNKLGMGESRVCVKMEIDGHTYAVKFCWGHLEDEYFADGNRRKHNRLEWKLYRTMPENIRAIMAEAFGISTCGRVIAFELVPQTVQQSHNGSYYDSLDETSDFNDNLNEALGVLGFNEKEIWNLTHDNHPNNLGIRENGDLVWIDYASC